MTKVTITSTPEGNAAPGEAPARADMAKSQSTARYNSPPVTGGTEGDRDGFASPRLEELLAQARRFATDHLDPASSAHSAAEAAYFDLPSEHRSAALMRAVDELDEVRVSALSEYENTVSWILDERPITPGSLLAHAKAFSDLIGNYIAANPSEVGHKRLCSDDQAKLLDFLITSLEDIDRFEGTVCGGDAVQAAWTAARQQTGPELLAAE